MGLTFDSSSHSTKEPEHLPTQQYQHRTPPLLKTMSGAGERRECGECASGAPTARSRCEVQKGRGRLRQHQTELRGASTSCARPHERPGADSHPPPHLAALLVMKADHHDVQYGPPGGAIASPPGLLHGRPPRARKPPTSTAKGGGPGEPRGPQEDGEQRVSGVSEGAA